MCGTSIRGGAPKGFGDWKIPQWTTAMLPQARALTDRGEMRTRWAGVRLFCIMPLWGGRFSALAIGKHHKYALCNLAPAAGAVEPGFRAGSLAHGGNVPADRPLEGFRRHGACRPRVGIYAYLFQRVVLFQCFGICYLCRLFLY